MSWVIKSANPFIPIWDEPGGGRKPKTGDRVKVLPWEWIEISIRYDSILDAGGPEGVAENVTDYEDKEDGAIYVRFPRRGYYVKTEYVEVI